MIQLESMLTALDPAASESFRVITHFDELVSRRVGVAPLLHMAAILAGCPAGASNGTISGTTVVSTNGTRLFVDRLPSRHWPAHQAGDDPAAWVWIERSGFAHANDAMVLERLALSIEISRQRSGKPSRRRPLDMLLDENTSAADRASAAISLGCDAHRAVAIVATPALTRDSDAPGSVSTEFGPLTALLDPVAIPRRAGIGPRVAVENLASAWTAAVTALRLTSTMEPALAADDLGPLLLLARVGDVSEDLSPLKRVIAAEPWADLTLDALVAADSIRSAAALLHLHHSTLQVRVAQLTTAMGFNLRTATGQARLRVLVYLNRLARTSIT